MTFKEIEISAAKGEQLPSDLNQSEQLCFLSLRNLYSDFRKGNINKDNAAKEKKAILINFEQSEKIHKQYIDILDERSKNNLEANKTKQLLLKGTEGTDEYDYLLVHAISCISLLTGDTAFFDTCKSNLIKRSEADGRLQ